MSAYINAHRSVVRARGRAKDHECIGCGAPAYDWAYQHCCEDPQFEEGRGTYSINVEDYEPMCRPCHSRLDEVGSLPEWYAQDPERAFATRSAAGKKGIAAASPKLKDHRLHLAERNHTLRRRCTCGFESTRAGVGRHQQISGHAGWKDLS